MKQMKNKTQAVSKKDKIQQNLFKTRGLLSRAWLTLQLSADGGRTNSGLAARGTHSGCVGVCVINGPWQPFM